MTFTPFTDNRRIARLEPPSGRVAMILDTDTFNEIDDQFALVYALLSPAQLDVQAIHATPFHNDRSAGPGDGMEKSYDEILRLLDKLGRQHDGFVFRGSTQWLADPATPVPSDAATDLVERAMGRQPDDAPLYVVAIGAITNVASAILIEPAIIERIVVVWLGGHGRHWPHTREFNLKQDVTAARIVFDCGVPLVHLPCLGVTSHLHTTVPEINAHVAGRGAIGDYLAHIFREYRADHFAWSKVLWDLAPVAWLIDDATVDTELTTSPLITDDVAWRFDAKRHTIRGATFVHRDPIYRDLFAKLGQGRAWSLK